MESTVGQGTVFDVYLPASSAAPRISAEPRVVTGTGRILMMDDDSAIRTLSLRMLARLGYECDVCGDGDEAVRQYGEAMRSGRPFDAVILDLTIPGHRGGVQVLPLLQELVPQVKAIVASGYGDDEAWRATRLTDSVDGCRSRSTWPR